MKESQTEQPSHRPNVRFLTGDRLEGKKPLLQRQWPLQFTKSSVCHSGIGTVDQQQILGTVAFSRARSLFQTQVPGGYLFNIEEPGGG